MHGGRPKELFTVQSSALSVGSCILEKLVECYQKDSPYHAQAPHKLFPSPKEVVA